MKLSSSLIKNARFFDVTLRDSLQSISRVYPINEKKKILHTVLQNQNIDAIEVGSFVSPKILPQMNYTDQLFNYAKQLSHRKKLFVLTPNTYAVKKALENDVKGFSLITSVSDKFQKTNINKSLSETKKNIENMVELIGDREIKLYISCINECPLSGKIKTDLILNEISEYYYKYDMINNICLSDTCGSLQFNDFKTIIDGMIKRGMDMRRFSIHLHENEKSPQDTRNIVLYALKNDITLFDVSVLNHGGCSITIKNSKNLHANLHYNFFTHFV